MKDKEFQDKIFSFLQERGYIWGPSPEIYGGVSGFYDYAPLGKLLKERILQIIRKRWQENDFWEVECPIVMPEKVWLASGHLNNFTDPLIGCKKCKASFRVDTLFDENNIKVEKRGLKEFEDIINKNKIKCPSCGNVLEGSVSAHNLMMKTSVGINQPAYNRPETATTTYLPFLRYFDFFRKKIPFGVFQIGKAFRNEISPRQLVLRMREFTQAESQLFIFKDQKDNFPHFEKIKKEKVTLFPYVENKEITTSLEDALKKKYFKNKAFAYNLWLAINIFKDCGLSKIRVRQHAPEEKAFYADDAWDIEFNMKSFGWVECCGVHDRTDYDLSQHSKISKKNLEVSDETHKKEIPHIIEIAFGVDRMLFAILDMGFEPLEIEQGKTTIHLPLQIAPVQIAIFPLVKKDLSPVAEKIYQELKICFTCIYDEAGSIGRRYLRAAEQGIPFCITIDHQTLQDETVTIRERDTERQIRRKISELKNLLYELLTLHKEFKDMK